MRSKKHSGTIRPDEVFIPEMLSKEGQAPIKKKNGKINNPKTLKQIARENNKLDDKELEEWSAKKMINPYYFIDRDLQIGFNLILDSQIINYANFIFTTRHNFSEFGIETRYNNKILKKDFFFTLD